MYKFLVILFILFLPVPTHASIFPNDAVSKVVTGTFNSGGVLMTKPSSTYTILYQRIQAIENSITIVVTCGNGGTEVTRTFVNFPGQNFQDSWLSLVCSSDLYITGISNGDTVNMLITYVPYDLSAVSSGGGSSCGSSTTSPCYSSEIGTTTTMFSRDEKMLFIIIGIILLSFPFWRFLFGGWGRGY